MCENRRYLLASYYWENRMKDEAPSMTSDEMLKMNEFYNGGIVFNTDLKKYFIYEAGDLGGWYYDEDFKKWNESSVRGPEQL